MNSPDTQRFAWTLFWPILAVGLGELIGAPLASAGQYYFDVGGGPSRIQNGQSFFGTSLADSLGLGAAYSFTVFSALNSGGSSLGYHLGLQQRMETNSSNTTYFGVQSTYLIGRLEYLRIFVSLGISPLIYRRVRNNSGIDHYLHVSSSYGILSEVGYELPITPEISFALVFTGTVISSNGAQSPKPVLDGSFLFRFFYGSPPTDPGADGSSGGGKYQGWRYPLGVPR